MALQYVVTKRVFGFDKTNTEKYVAKSVGSGKMNFDKMCEKVSRLCGIHRKVVDLVVSGLVDMMAEDIDDGKTIQMGEFGLFRPTIKTKSASTEDAVKASNILSKRIVFTPGKIFNRMLNEMSVTRSVPVDTDYTDGSSSSGNNAEKVNGVWEQRLRIHYNCVGTIEIPGALPLPTPAVSVNTRKGVVVNYAPCDVAI